ncbi:MAG TPA: hypothetical protein DD490_14195 [Acidobacteria bacterium]|nr:hypothetical protein [Acidobacteriota bacterium]
MNAVAERGYLLVRSDGVLWGVSNGDVRRLTRQGLRYHLEVGGIALGVDEVVGVVPELVVWPVSSALRRFWPEKAGGLAVHAEAPLVIIDPRRLPRALCIEGIEGEIADGEGRH